MWQWFVLNVSLLLLCLLRYRFLPGYMPYCGYWKLCNHLRPFTGTRDLDVIFDFEVLDLAETISVLYNNTIVYLLSILKWSLFGFSAKQLGPILKLFLCLCLPVGVILWLVVSIVGSVLGGAIYGFLSPIFATFDAVGEGKSDPLFHCFYVSFLHFTVLYVFADYYLITLLNCFRMELGALFKAVSPLSVILKMFAFTPTFRLWMILEQLARIVIIMK